MVKGSKGAYRLTLKETTFCYEWIANGGNATKAYKAAYSATTTAVAGKEAHKLLKKPKIQDLIAKLTKRHLERIGYKADDILNELAHLGFSDLKNHIDFKDGKVTVKSFEEMGVSTRCIKKFEIKEQFLGNKPEEETILDRQIKFELHDKKGSLELLGKNLKLFVDKVEHSGKVNVENDQAADAAYKNRFSKKK